MIGLASTDQLYFASGRPRPPRRDVHREPQPRAVQRHQAVPRRRPAGRHWTPGSPRSATPVARRRHAGRRRARATITERDVLAAYADHLLTLAPVAGRRLQGRRRRRQRDGRAHRPRGLRAARRRASSWCRCTSSSTAPSRTTRPTRSSRPTWSTCRRGSSRRRPTSASPSTATPTGASWSTSAAGRSRPSTLTALIAARELAREPGRDA